MLTRLLTLVQREEGQTNVLWGVVLLIIVVLLVLFLVGRI
jgi:hypothetical protein